MTSDHAGLQIIKTSVLNTSSTTTGEETTWQTEDGRRWHSVGPFWRPGTGDSYGRKCGQVIYPRIG